MNSRILLTLSLLTNVVLVCLWFRCCMHRNPSMDVMTAHSDTVVRYLPARDSSLHHLAHRVPRPTHIGHDTTTLHHLDTVFYTDTIYHPQAYRVLIFDTLHQNAIIGRGLSIADLHPIELRTVETAHTIVSKPPFIQCSLGLSAFAGGRVATTPYPDWDIGPSLLLNIRSHYQFTYTYYTQHNVHAVGGYVKLIFK